MLGRQCVGRGRLCERLRKHATSLPRWPHVGPVQEGERTVASSGPTATWANVGDQVGSMRPRPHVTRLERAVRLVGRQRLQRSAHEAIRSSR